MSVEDDVRAAYEANTKPPIEGEFTVVDETPAVPETEAAQTASEEPAKPGRTANRQRDEHGRLLPGKKEAAPEPAAESAPTTQVAPEGAETPAAVPIPNSLKAAFKAQWGTLSQEWRAEIARIDQAGVKGAEHLREAARFADEVRNVVKPYEQMIAAEGGTAPRAIADLLHTAAVLRTGTQEQKQQVVQQILRQFGVQMPSIDPALLQPGATPQAPAFDPSAHPLIRTLAERTEKFDQLLKQQEQQEIQGNQTVVEAFLSETDAQGNAMHPMDDSMHEAFAREIAEVKATHPEMGKKQILEAAYDNLSWKTPEIREVRLARLETDREAQRKAKEKEALAAKRNASGSITGAPTSTAPVGGQSVRDIVAQQVYQAGRI